MKRNYLFSFLAFAFFNFSVAAAVFSGKITNPSEFEIVVGGLNFKAVIPVAPDGSFSKDLDLKHNGIYTFTNGSHRWEFYLDQTSALQLYFDESNLKQSVTYNGPAANASQYLYQKQQLYDALNADATKNYALNDTDFAKLIDDTVLLNLELLNNASNLDAFFRKTETKNIAYNAQSYYYNYKYLHSYYTKSSVPKAKICESRLFNKDSAYFSFDEFLFSPVFRGYEYGKFSKSFTPKFKKNPEKAKEILIAEFASTNNPVIEEFTLRSLAGQLSNFDDKNNHLIKAIIDLVQDEELKKNLTEKIENKGKFINGAAAPHFQLNDQNGNPVSLDDFKGKNIYIDFWATWCKPCVAEIPDLKKLEEKFKNKNIVFLSISLDSEKDLEKWKNYIVKKELGGTQLIVENAWKSDVVGKYMVESIPRFILIDTDGNLVDTNAPRPSGKAGKAINRLDNL